MFNLTPVKKAVLSFPGRFESDNEISAIGNEAIVCLVKNFTTEVRCDAQLELMLQDGTKLALTRSQGTLYIGKEIIE